MLILTRRVGERLFIGDDITVTVLGARCSQTRLGIQTPPDVVVHREEIYLRNKEGEGANPASPQAHEQGAQKPRGRNAR